MKKQDEFIRYIALLASRVTAGETDPAAINWRYLRDRASVALACDGGQTGEVYELRATHKRLEAIPGQG